MISNLAAVGKVKVVSAMHDIGTGKITWFSLSVDGHCVKHRAWHGHDFCCHAGDEIHLIKHIALQVNPRRNFKELNAVLG